MELLRYIAEGIFHSQLLFMVGEGQVAHGSAADPFLKYGIFRKNRIQLDGHGSADLFVGHMHSLPFSL